MSIPTEHQFYPKLSAHKIEVEKAFIKDDWQETHKKIIDCPKNAEFDLDLADVKPTSWKNNKRVKIHDKEVTNEESRRTFVKDELLKVATDYIDANCEKGGRQIRNNLSISSRVPSWSS